MVTHEVRFAQQVVDEAPFPDTGVIGERGPPARVIGDPDEAGVRHFLHRVLDPI